MNRARKNCRGGFTLIETLVYMSMLFVILGMGYLAMYKSMDASTGLRRNATDITRAVEAGEHWREDVRDATQPIRLEPVGENETVLHIPQAQAEVTYLYSSNSISRRVGQGDWFPVLEHVKTAQFVADQRQKVSAWRWELELEHYRKSTTRTRPLFTFVAVATNNLAK